MKSTKSHEIKIETPSGNVSGILDLPTRSVAALTLAHGAGAGMNHTFMQELAAALVKRGIAVLRFQFPYMEAGKKRTDSPKVAMATVAAAVRELRARVPKVPLFAAGKSFGSRMTTSAGAEGLLENVEGIICFGFPLHPAGKEGVQRAEHLADVPMQMLFLQGTRDDLANLKLMREVCKTLNKATLHIVEHADHGFAVLKRSGRTSEEVMHELADQAFAFTERIYSS